jgi:PAS domain S-box-containing protein
MHNASGRDMTRSVKSDPRRRRRKAAVVPREEGLRHLADALPQLVWVARPDGYIEHYNQSCLDYTGLTHDELLGWGWRRVLHPDEVDVKVQLWAEALATGNVFEIEYRLRQSDGRYQWHLGRALPFRDANGKIVKWFGTSTNIEAQKQAEQALRESQHVLEQTVADRTAELTRANAALTRAEEELSLLNTIIVEVAAAQDLTDSLAVVLCRVCEKTGWAIGQAWIPRDDGDCLECSPAWFAGVGGLEHFRGVSEKSRFCPGVGLPGRVWASGQPGWIRDVTLDANFPRAQAARDVGLKGALGIPIVAGGKVVAVVEFFLQEPRDEDERLTKVIATVAAQLDLVLERKQAEEAVREQQAMLRLSFERIHELAGRLIIAQEAERRRIARDLHDDISQQLAGLSIALSGLRRRAGDHDRATLDASLAALQQRTTALADSVRRISHDLHPGVLQQVGLTAALESHCAEFQKQHGIDVIFRGAEDVTGIDPDAALCLFRAAQETLRNVAKHAAAHHVQVALSRDHDELTLTIVDDGSGFDAAQIQRAGGGLGLLSIEERARLLHGSVRIASGAERGTAVRIAIPTPAH